MKFKDEFRHKIYLNFDIFEFVDGKFCDMNILSKAKTKSSMLLFYLVGTLRKLNHFSMCLTDILSFNSLKVSSHEKVCQIYLIF